MDPLSWAFALIGVAWAGLLLGYCLGTILAVWALRR
jgi:hypothetical protein